MKISLTVKEFVHEMGMYRVDDVYGSYLTVPFLIEYKGIPCLASHNYFMSEKERPKKIIDKDGSRHFYTKIH